jgi:putative membrane protein
VKRRPFAWRPLLTNAGGQAVASAAIAVTATVAYLEFGHEQLHISTAFTAVLGAVMAIVLGFRNNSAYGRWWEARTLWGAIVNDSRNLARQVEALVPEAARADLLERHVAWTRALCRHLTGEAPGPGNVPAVLMREQGRQVAALGLDPVLYVELDATLTRLTNAQGGCERIRNTPFPEQYEDVTHALVWLYCIAFPFTVVGELRWWTIPASIVVCFAFQGIDAVGRYLETPFEGEPLPLPLGKLCQTIEDELRPVTTRGGGFDI